MIVVEGPDGGGKSTLCQWLCDRFGLKMGERGVKDRDQIWRTTRQDTWNAMMAELKCDAPPLVWDRLGPISDPIYSQRGIPENRPCAFHFNELRVFHSFIREVGLLILCLPPKHVVMANVENSHQLPNVARQSDSIYRAYMHDVAPHITYDYTRDHGQQLLHHVNRYLVRRRERECLSSGRTALSE